jgi:hypothetical protein
MAITIPSDPTEETRRLRTRMEVESAKPTPDMDEKELAEREEAAQAYAGEDETHFVMFLNDCVKMSRDSMTDIRYEQAECWDVFNEKEPVNYQWKEQWQSRTVIPKPNVYILAFLAIVRKAFDPQFLSIENEQDTETADFIRKLMTLMLAKSFSNFPINFTDATCMGAAVGQSMEMIPMWRPKYGPYWELIEPWKIHRDPDSLSRQSQSGMFWIHDEWLDFYELKEMEKRGTIVNLQDCGPGGQWGNPKSDENLDPGELKRRRDMLYQQSAYRTKVLTSEFWGTILDRRGHLLLPSATYWVVADRVVRLPKNSPYPTLRWPGTGFAPMPHLLRFDGRSLLTGLKSLWYAICNLFALHLDNLNWTVNPQKELSIRRLVDQEDLDDYPGKIWLTLETEQGQQVIRTVDRKNITSEILANVKVMDQIWQVGGPVAPSQQGVPDYRAEKTAREAAQDLEQSNNLMSLAAENIDNGALDAIQALWEVTRINITYWELATWMGREVADRYRDNSTTGLRLPSLTTGAFKVSGAASLLRNQEVVSTISKLILPLCEPKGLGQLFNVYLEPKGIIQAIIKRSNLEDEGIMVSKEKADQISQAQQEQQDAQIKAQQEKEAQQARLVGAQAHEVTAEGDRHIAQADHYAAQAGAVAGAAAGPEAAAAPTPEAASAGEVQ